MKLKNVASAVAIAAAALAAPAANAAFVIGGTSFAGGFNQPGAFTNLPGSIVSGLNAFSIDPAALAIGSTGNFAGFVTGLANANSFDKATPPTVLYTDGGFTFQLLAYGPSSVLPFSCSLGQCNDTIAFSGVGVVSGNGFQATGFTMAWSAQGSCNDNGAGACAPGATASWSASISATGTNPPLPEPASLALVGLALAGVGVTARRRAAK